MIRKRMFGNDLPFLAWCRAQQAGLPSMSVNCGIGINDVDCMIHRYITATDSVGTRDLQALMHLEVKTRGGDVTSSQHDTYWKLHNCCFVKNRTVGGQTVRHFGVSFLFLSDETPDDSTLITWGRFRGATKAIDRRGITVHQLFQLIRFDVDPDTFSPRWHRRHHKTRELLVVDKSPLGFEVERPVIIRS